MVIRRVCPRRLEDSGVNDAAKPSWFISETKREFSALLQTLIRLSFCALLIQEKRGFSKPGLVDSSCTTCTGTLARGQSQPYPRLKALVEPVPRGRLFCAGTGCGPSSLVGRSGASRGVMARSAVAPMVRVGVAGRCGRMTAVLPVLPVGFVRWQTLDNAVTGKHAIVDGEASADHERTHGGVLTRQLI